MNGRMVFRVVAGALMAPVFLLSMAVQYNDPDPLGWILMYGAALVVSVQAARNAGDWRLAAFVAASAGVWAITLAPGAIEFLRSDHEPLAFYMKTGDALEEVAREWGGLLIVLIWCTLATWFERTRPRAPAHHAEPT